MAIKIEKFRPHFLKLFEKTVASGDTENGEVTFSDSFRIKKIFLVETSGTSLNNVTISLRIDDETITHDKIPATMFTESNRYNPDLNWSVVNGNKLYYGITNNTASSITVIGYAIIDK